MRIGKAQVIPFLASPENKEEPRTPAAAGTRVPGKALNIDRSVVDEAVSDVCDEFKLCDGLKVCRTVDEFPKEIQALCDPGSHKLQELANLTSSALSLAPDSPGVQSVSILCGSVGAFERWRQGRMSPVQAKVIAGGLVCQTLSAAADHFGHPSVAAAGRTVALLLRMADSSTRLIVPHGE